uniref:Integrase catalytic domain-containing protein n=1 Tax=Chenopodium quinoa TaxID=63459 RepID=A0A803N974_CHEQI
MTKPTGKVAAQALAQKASKYCLISNVLFKKSVAGPFLRCLEVKEAQQVLQSLHTEAYKEIKDKHVISFIKRNILSRFGVPADIIIDNGSQFISNKTTKFYKEWNISLITSTPRYPQANGQAESSNKVLKGNMKKRLEGAKRKWADELPNILWADRTTPKGTIGHTPFSLVYGCEAVIPTEVEVPTARYGLMTEERNQAELIHNLDTVEELREDAKMRMTAYEQEVARSFNKNVRTKVFKLGDWVLKKVYENTREANAGKLAPNWEGPYEIIKVVGNGAYRLINAEGKELQQSWNATHLKLYHFEERRSNIYTTKQEHNRSSHSKG